jgi:cytochrome c oxidase assembly factor CtaG
VAHWIARGAARSTAALVALAPTRASAHAGSPSEPFALLDVLTVAALAVGLLAYATGLACAPRAVRRRRRAAILAFCGGYLALGIALLSPLDGWAAASVTAHMAQHLLLVVVAAPLLVLARPWHVVLRVVPVARGGAWAARLVSVARATATLAPWVWSLHVVVLWAWHAPPLWTAALAHPWLHALEHAGFFGTALLFWWIALDPQARRRLGPVASLVFLFGGAMQSTALGALLVLAERPWYAAGSALDDQHLAGVLMWMPAAAAYLVAALAILEGVLRRRSPGAAR